MRRSGRLFVGHAFGLFYGATSAIDVSVQVQNLNLLRQLQRELEVSYLFITDNIGVVEHIADDAAVMNRRRIEESGLAHAVPAHPRSDNTRTWLPAVNRIRQGFERRAIPRRPQKFVAGSQRET